MNKRVLVQLPHASRPCLSDTGREWGLVTLG